MSLIPKLKAWLTFETHYQKIREQHIYSPLGNNTMTNKSH